MNNLNVGSVFKIISSKYNGTFHRSWEKNIALSYNGETLIGGNDRTIVKEANREEWYTKERAIFYFHKYSWFNVIVVFEVDEYYYYCNISSPFTWKNEALHYIDYDIDIIVRSDFAYEIVDEDEFNKNKKTYTYPLQVQQQVYDAVDHVKSLIQKRVPPFSDSFVQKWGAKLIEYTDQHG